MSLIDSPVLRSFSLKPLLVGRICVSLFLAIWLLGVSLAGADVLEFSIQEGNAVRTLKLAAKQAEEVEILYSARVVKGYRTQPVVGTFSLQEALDRMLEDTPLEAVPVSGGEAYAIMMKKTDEMGARPNLSEDQKRHEPIGKETQMNLQNTKKKQTLANLFKGILAAAVAGSSHSPAQDEPDYEVYELSPFSIEASDSSGYLATSTLAGTRIKTKMRDVGASISVVTKEFLEDTGATSAEDLLVYVGNAEVNGLGGNFSGASLGDGVNTESAHRSMNNSTRIRGLNNADTTRNYFLTDIPFDSYNTDRVLINRGPNAVLFGLGSPAGIINNGLVSAAFKDMNDIEFRYDRYGSERLSFDFNRVLLEDQFAFRLAGLYDNQKYQQDFAFEKDRRVFATFTYSPFKKITEANKTILRGHVELGEVDANRPRLSPPGDTITTWWTHANQETVPHTLDWRDTNRNLFSIPGSWFFQLGVVYPDEATAQLGSTEAFVPITPANYTDNDFLAGFRGIATYQDYAAGRSGWPAQVENGRFYRDNMILDSSIYDFRNHLLDGPNKSEYANLEAYNITLEQELLNGQAGFEIALDEQRWEEGFYGMLNGIDAYSVQIDVNPNYPDGSVNPNFGRPFVAGNGRAGDNETIRESLRFTGFYEFDFRDRGEGALSNILGRHTFTGMYNSNEINRQSASYIGAGPDQRFLNLYGRSNILDGNFGDARILHYLGGSLADSSSATGANIPGIQVVQPFPSSIQSLYWNPESQTWVNESVPLTTYANSPNSLVSGASKTADEIDSLAFIWQGYLFSDNLVLTTGWREDEADSFRAPTPARDPIDNHVLLNDPNFVLDTTPLGSAKQQTWTYSAVMHAPEFVNEKLPFNSNLSLHFSQSENFEPVPARFNIVGDPLASPTGETEDYGITWSLFDERVVARINFFETQQSNVGASGVPTGAFISREIDVRTANSLGINDGNSQLANYRLPPQEILDFWGWTETVQPNGSVTVQTSPNGSIAAVTARQTKGMEFDLTYNPTRNWRLQFNVSQQEAIQDGLDEGVQKMLAERLPVYAETGTLLDSAANFTMEEVRNATIIDPWNRVRLGNGAAVQELREWRWNLITNYQFEEDTMLKGFGVGGALRWQDEVAIGAPVIFSDLVDDFVLDVNNPIMGESELNGDLWFTYGRSIFDEKVDWNLKLHIRNLIGGDDLIAIAAQPNGALAGVRIPSGMVWQLSSGFSFQSLKVNLTGRATSVARP